MLVNYSIAVWAVESGIVRQWLHSVPSQPKNIGPARIAMSNFDSILGENFHDGPSTLFL